MILFNGEIRSTDHRNDRNTFRCVQCGFSGNADHIAAINIAARAVEVNQRIVACGEVEAVRELRRSIAASSQPFRGSN